MEMAESEHSRKINWVLMAVEFSNNGENLPFIGGILGRKWELLRIYSIK